VLADHGWHVAYILLGWLGALPRAVSARLEHRRHAAFNVEDTANVHLTFPRATAEIVLTWAADERRNWAKVSGTEGSLEIHDGLLIERYGARERRREWSPSLSNGSVHPEWFDPVIDDFVDAVQRGDAGTNLLEAHVCTAIQDCARESHRRGGIDVPLVALTGYGTSAEAARSR
jgi:predicted dehydrogenase